MGETFLRIVETFDGSKALKGNCKHIKGQFYEMNKQCFLMPDGKWHRINNGLLEFDHRYGRWVIKASTPLTHGVIGGTPDAPEYGYFSVLGDEIAVRTEVGRVLLLNEALVDELELSEDISTGGYVTKSISRGRKYVGPKRVYDYPIRLDYNSEPSLEKSIESFNRLRTPGELDFFSKELGNTTFGLEIETWNGTVSYRHLAKLGIIPLKDGSLSHDGIRSYEYATVPLRGAEGLFTIKKIFDTLQIYTSISKFCSLHIHLGGYKKSKEFVVNLYKLILNIQDEVFDLFPKWYKDTSNFKAKNYCGPLPVVTDLKLSDDEIFSSFYHWISMGDVFDDFTNSGHPRDPHGDHKWDIHTRYFWVNLVPFIWGRRNTIEFRVHPPTLNPIKAINWLFITNAILKYASLYGVTKDVTLNKIVSKVYSPELSKYLVSYMSHLKSYRTYLDSISDFQGDLWVKDDLNLDFNGMELIVNKFNEL